MQPFDAQLVVDVMFEFYRTLFKFPFFLPFSALILPPHRYSEQEIQKYAPHIEPVVLDLIKRLPYLKDVYMSGGQTIGPGMQSLNLKQYLSFAQDPLKLEEDIKEEVGLYVSPWCVTLTDGRFGKYMILNTRTGTITEVDWVTNNEPEGFSPHYYGHQSTYLAEDVLRKRIRRYITLEWIPWGDISGDQNILQGDSIDEEEKQYYQNIKDIYLIHGWPDNVQQEELEAALKAYAVQRTEKKRAKFEASIAEQNRVRLNAKQQEPISHREL